MLDASCGTRGGEGNGDGGWGWFAKCGGRNDKVMEMMGWDTGRM